VKFIGLFCLLIFMLEGCSSHPRAVPPVSAMKSAASNGAAHQRKTSGSVRVITGPRSVGPGPIITTYNNGTQVYSYVPTVMKDGQYRMWWCTFNTNFPNDANDVGGGDAIAYSTASNLDGPWSTPRVGVLAQSPSGAWDHGYTCDPSVIRAASTLIMYYAGLTRSTGMTSIGVASSSDDGQTWQRANGGNPIITPAVPSKGGYGAGQPSVIVLDGMYYLAYTDTTGIASDPNSGAGIYVLRSTDATFQTNVEELTGPGTFTPYSAARHTAYSLINAFSIDWKYVDTDQAFAIATNDNANGIGVHFLPHDLTATELPGSPVTIPASSIQDGPGMVSHPNGHAVPGTTCGDFPLDFVMAAGQPPSSTWALWHVTASMSTGLSCGQINLGQVYEGAELHSSGLPLAVVLGAARINFALAPPADRIARNGYSVSNEIFNDVPYEASVFSGNQALSAPGRPGAFLLDDGKLYPTNCAAEMLDNNSSQTGVTTAQWDSHPVGQTFWCLNF
jgi:hypothetical protein